MARKPRIEFEGAFYHVIVRGNQKQKIFKDNHDFLQYQQIINAYKANYHYYLYSYVLMSNHIHLLIETRDTPLSKIMQGINQRYTMYFNRKYKTVGHLFQGRYKAILCDRNAYLLTLIKYIHMNPVRAKIAESISKYQWSSHHEYMKKRKKKGIIDVDQVLRMFSEDKSAARKLYRTYMGDEISVKKEDIYRTVDQRIMGTEQFVEDVMERHDVELSQERKAREYSMAEIAKAVEKVMGIKLKQIRQKSKLREISRGRQIISIVSGEYGYKGKEISEFIHKDAAMITRYMKEKGKLKEEVKNVIEMMKKERNNVNSQV